MVKKYHGPFEKREAEMPCYTGGILDNVRKKFHLMFKVQRGCLIILSALALSVVMHQYNQNLLE